MMDKKETVLKKLDEINVQYELINHKAIFSEDDTDFDVFCENIMIGKNLFLRNDKKTAYYLVCLPLTKRANLKELAEKLNEKRFSFASEKELKEYLNISPGSVSYLNVITASCISNKFKEVTYIIDEELFDLEKVGFHPSDNTATVITDKNNITKIYDYYNLKYIVIKL